MDTNDYINILKSTNLRPSKIRITQQPQFLNENEQPKSNIADKIIEFFVKNPNPPDEKVHGLAGSLGMEPDKFETHVYKILSDLIHLGRSKNFTGKYDPKELAMGTKVELEHMPYPLIAEKIAKDHLAEIPDYYTRLKKMEAAGGVTENHLLELFVQQGEINAMDEGMSRDISMLRLAMIAELDASNLYDRMAALASDGNVKEVMLDISKEEKVHAGEFETLLEDLDTEYEEAEKEGEGEVEDLTGTKEPEE